MIIFSLGISAQSELPGNKSVVIDNKEKAKVNIKKNEADLSFNPKASSFNLTPEKKPFSMIEEDKWTKPKVTITQPFGEKHAQAMSNLKRDQYLGNIKTSSGKVTIMCRDHEYVDGDKVRLYLNDDIIQPTVYLSHSYYVTTIELQPGQNRLDFQALNQGSSGPNTAELKVYDADGNLISSNQWNLLSGYKATLILTK
ncbi:hypothetical protein GCM10009117_12140 [Gangjinia marincola]|uniref:Secreted protein n=2 Tax=Gangjinia marincola TaxID=578463 RepID=A0ABN1MFX3_9FLAO